MRVGPFDVKGKRTGQGRYDIYVRGEIDRDWRLVGNVDHTAVRGVWWNSRTKRSYHSKWEATLGLVEDWTDAEIKKEL